MKNPIEYRRFRFSLWAVYIAAALFVCAALLVSGFRGSRERMGSRPEPAPRESVDAAALAGCMSELEALHAEQRARLDAMLASWPARRSGVEWEDWSPAWRSRLLAVGARCRLEERDVPGSADIAQAYELLGKLHRHYTTLAVQFSKETGPHADRLYEAMEKARRSTQLPAAAR